MFHGRIKDEFTPVIEESLVNSELRWRCTVLDDDNEKITAAIGSMLDQGMDMVICTGGMSVDPDDKTPLAIKNSGAKVVSYGAPVLPVPCSCWHIQRMAGR